MSKLGSVAQVMEMDPLVQEQYPNHNLGEPVYMADQRIFRYAHDGGSGLAAGKLAVAATPNTALATMAVSAVAAVGATSISFTAGATTATNGAYDDGYAIISYGVGLGQTYKIKHCPAITSGGAITLTLYDGLVVALDTTSKLDIVQNTYSAVQNTTTITNAPAGVPQRAVTASYYAWLQTRGVCSLLSAGTIAAGTSGIMVATSGAITVPSGTFGNDMLAGYGTVGSAVYAAASGYYHPVFLRID